MKVTIPSPLHSYTSGKSTVDANGTTVDQLTRDLDQQFPGLRFRIIDEQENIRPHVKIFVNRNQIFSLNTKLEASDEVAIVQAFSGG